MHGGRWRKQFGPFRSDGFTIVVFLGAGGGNVFGASTAELVFGSEFRSRMEDERS